MAGRLRGLDQYNAATTVRVIIPLVRHDHVTLIRWVSQCYPVSEFVHYIKALPSALQ